jgi:hypothetical protein
LRIGLCSARQHQSQEVEEGKWPICCLAQIKRKKKEKYRKIIDNRKINKKEERRKKKKPLTDVAVDDVALNGQDAVHERRRGWLVGCFSF